MMTVSEDDNPDLDAPKTCQKIEDVYTQQARRRLYRLGAEYCARNKVTVSEVLHSGSLIRRFEDFGTALQHVLQLQATTQASALNIPVRDALGQISHLANKLIERVVADDKSGVFAELPAPGIGALADEIAKKGAQAAANDLYRLNGAIVRRLHTATDWNEKLYRLISLLDGHTKTEAGANLLAAALDEFLAEILQMQAAVLNLIGEKHHFSQVVIAEAELFLGRYRDTQLLVEAGHNGLNLLAEHLAAGRLPVARSELGHRIVADIKSLKPLREDSVEAEMADFHKLADLVREGIGPCLPHEAAMPALELRAARFVAPESLQKNLANLLLPEDKVAWLFTAESCIVGARSRYKIADMIFRTITAKTFTGRFQSTQLPSERRLQAMAKLNAAAMASGFDADQKKRMAAHFDTIGYAIARQIRLFEGIESKPIPACHKVQTILKLFEDGMVTQGKFSAEAQQVVLRQLGQPGFLSGYLQACAQGHNKLDKLAVILELVRSLQRIGLKPEAILGSLAV